MAARPIPTMAEARRGQVDDLTFRSPDGLLWSRVNTAEAAPGVMTPLTSSYYVYSLEVAARRGFHSLGLIPRSATGYPLPVEERMFGCFHGRLTANVNIVRRMFSSLPGVTGEDVERDLLGSSRPGVPEDHYRWRAPALMSRLAQILLVRRADPQRNRVEMQRWWRATVHGAQLAPGLSPEATLQDSLTRFIACLEFQAWTRMLLQAITGQVTALAEQAGEPDAVAMLLSGAAGTEEAAIADDLWRVATEQVTLDRFLEQHGYHGPNGGDPAARAWRENPRPLERLLATVATAEPPTERRTRAVAERERVAQRLVARLPAARRPAARLTVRMAPVAARALERTKTAFLIAIDGGRAAVRARGAELAAMGALDDPEDAFHLFADELLSARGSDVRERASERRELHARCLELEVPETWEGQPVTAPKRDADHSRAMRVEGLGVSPGVAEGRVRVVLDPAADIELELGDILVCPTTDPSWVSMMTVAGALVIDIGAAASHGAIVARELGVPCVIGTRTGTVALRDGDRVRVDGSAGVVEVLTPGADGASP
jgi:pyruvate, water dikinase